MRNESIHLIMNALKPVVPLYVCRLGCNSGGTAFSSN